MTTIRIALANIRVAETPEESVQRASAAIREAGRAGVDLIGFSECYVPGYRAFARKVALPDAAFLDRAWETIAEVASESNVGVVLGTERLVGESLFISALVIQRDGTIAGYQDKVQLDPTEDAIYTPGTGRHVFQAGPVTFGISICHEGFRYPETVRFAAKRGAQIVFHPHLSEAEPGSFRPTSYADPANSFHEKSILCRAAENTCFVATVNCASEGSPTTSAIANPDGTLLSYQPYGKEGLLIADLDLAKASGYLASRHRAP
jgi:predicted amidohydrolase